ncbi:glutamyl-tRNA reductase [Flavobacteriaceae bacterium UJ101]|nr:glutamyl-tRNA reductase [Flavobacteriaceae bacterium UJ101]
MTEYNVTESKHFYLLGVSYKKADEKVRGKYTIFPDTVPELVREAKRNRIHHFFVVSTCNRTEVYAFADDYSQVIDALCAVTKGNKEELESISFIKKDFDAINHLFRVGSGLESQIVGDFEIIGQMKTWFSRFKKMGTTNAFLERLINTAIQVSKKIKQNTTLSSGVTSVSYAAVNYILTQVEKPSSKKILLFGTGKIGRNTCENLIKHTDHTHVTLINRTEEKAERIAKKYEVNSKSFDELENEINLSDIIIVATGAQTPTVLKEHIRTDKELLFIDLSIPANVDRSIKELSNVTVLGVDELSSIIAKSIEKRKEQVPEAERIISEMMNEFKDWLETRKYVPFIQAFKERLEDIHHIEHTTLKKKEVIETDNTVLAEKVIQKLTNHLANHLLENKGDAKDTMELINKVFKVQI